MQQTNIPVLALRNLVIFPGMTLPIRVGRRQSVAALKRAIQLAEIEGRTPTLFAVLQRGSEGPAASDRIDVKDLASVGVVCELEKVKGTDQEGYHLFLKGVTRARALNYREESDGSIADALIATEIHPIHPTWTEDPEKETQAELFQMAKEAAKELLNTLPGSNETLTQIVDSMKDFEFFINAASANLDISNDDKQALLEPESLRDRATLLIETMSRIQAEQKVRGEIREKLSNKLGKHQREVILREQLKAIREELGEDGAEEDKLHELRKQIEESAMPDAVKKVARDELKRLEALSNQSPETHILRSYLELLVQLPWASMPESPIDLDEARRVLDADHFGLDKVKKRILELLAVMKLKRERSPEHAKKAGLILLLVGPPGVGKTSLGSSIAKALNRKFVRAALGGVRDDAEIRGHRRTYVGAMPGRIIQALKRVGTKNPVFLLDEIDKLSRGYSGDPASALLEVLDPEQNSTFRDHYLDVDYDLSEVLFIATANSLEGIPAPLLDRMEVIEINGYTALEKQQIGASHLLPKLLEEHSIRSDELTVSPEMIEHVIARYTKEAGVRTLKRTLSALVRWLATQVVRPDFKAPLALSKDHVREALGPERYDEEESLRAPAVGVATGLAWTPVGGEILFIEANHMPGSGKLILTGQLGEVMKESVQIALTLLRSRLPWINEQIAFEKTDFHVHVPAGAIPKDGPSAGVAMATALASLFLKRPVTNRIAMTGEITLRGKVTPIGGVKEKILAAYRAGIRTVLIPRKNERDLRELPEEVRSTMQIELVDDVSDVLRATLGVDFGPIDQTTGLWGASGPVLPPVT